MASSRPSNPPIAPVIDLSISDDEENLHPSVSGAHFSSQRKTHIEQTAPIELSTEQQEVMDAVMKGESMFFTGSAGMFCP
jgi:hypothetical protein